MNWRIVVASSPPDDRGRLAPGAIYEVIRYDNWDLKTAVMNCMQQIGERYPDAMFVAVYPA